MLEVKIDKIVPINVVRDMLNDIVSTVESTDDLYVITRDGIPAAIIVGVHHLEKLTGLSHEELMPNIAPTAAVPDQYPATPQAEALPEQPQNVPAATSAPATESVPVQPQTEATIDNFSFNDADLDNFDSIPDSVPAPAAAPMPASSVSSPQVPVTPAEEVQASTFATPDINISAPLPTPATETPAPDASQAVQPAAATAADENGVEDMFAPAYGSAQYQQSTPAMPAGQQPANNSTQAQ